MCCWRLFFGVDGVVYHVHCWAYNAWKFAVVPTGEYQDLQKCIDQPNHPL